MYVYEYMYLYTGNVYNIHTNTLNRRFLSRDFQQKTVPWNWRWLNPSRLQSVFHWPSWQWFHHWPSLHHQCLQGYSGCTWRGKPGYLHLLKVCCNLRTNLSACSLTGITPKVLLDLIFPCFPHTHSIYELYYNMLIHLLGLIHLQFPNHCFGVSKGFDTQNSHKVPLSGSQCKWLILRVLKK